MDGEVSILLTLNKKKKKIKWQLVLCSHYVACNWEFGWNLCGATKKKCLKVVIIAIAYLICASPWNGA